MRQTEQDFMDKVLKENLDGLTGTTVCVALIHGNVLYAANGEEKGFSLLTLKLVILQLFYVGMERFLNLPIHILQKILLKRREF